MPHVEWMNESFIHYSWMNSWIFMNIHEREWMSEWMSEWMNELDGWIHWQPVPLTLLPILIQHDWQLSLKPELNDPSLHIKYFNFTLPNSILMGPNSLYVSAVSKVLRESLQLSTHNASHCVLLWDMIGVMYQYQAAPNFYYMFSHNQLCVALRYDRCHVSISICS